MENRHEWVLLNEQTDPKTANLVEFCLFSSNSKHLFFTSTQDPLANPYLYPWLDSKTPSVMPWLSLRNFWWLSLLYPSSWNFYLACKVLHKFGSSVPVFHPLFLRHAPSSAGCTSPDTLKCQLKHVWNFISVGPYLLPAGATLLHPWAYKAFPDYPSPHWSTQTMEFKYTVASLQSALSRPPFIRPWSRWMSVDHVQCVTHVCLLKESFAFLSHLMPKTLPRTKLIPAIPEFFQQVITLEVTCMVWKEASVWEQGLDTWPCQFSS